MEDENNKEDIIPMSLEEFERLLKDTWIQPIVDYLNTEVLLEEEDQDEQPS